MRELHACSSCMRYLPRRMRFMIMSTDEINDARRVNNAHTSGDNQKILAGSASALRAPGSANSLPNVIRALYAQLMHIERALRVHNVRDAGRKSISELRMQNAVHSKRLHLDTRHLGHIMCNKM